MMKKVRLGSSDLKVSQMVLGMMRSSAADVKALEAVLEKALELDINFIDHADIYAWRTPAESLYGELVKARPELKDKFIVQTKCGICQGYYDLSYEHIMESVEQSLTRMNLEKIDVLLLHRPDALMEPEEIAKAFDELQLSGKVLNFGVSNMNPGQISRIQKCVRQPLITDQMQLSIVHSSLIDQGIYVNMKDEQAVMRDGSLLDYLDEHNMSLQAWSIIQAGWEEGCFIDHPNYKELNDKLEELSKKYKVTKSAIAVAWILRHPANILPIAGTVNPTHLEEMAKAFELKLTRQEWYSLYLATGKKLP
ncbi:Predicted oxidoreductase [Lachnospira pectinoschiza]|uniref:Predicted oxidoreductase n=2 Tax=Lachnospira pectinoschiza TaxID=28052 RepID=A0A1G9SZP9_9FIRM|nr:aldo/keto reductase [Lachnospira pectinoschiza]SDM40890.1 Predicted oxidoreductase [Lachnospira pectinoschiza]